MRERILDLCSQRFRQRGIRNYSMDELATELGVSKKTIYQHFPKKKDIVMAFVELWMESDEKQLQEQVERNAHPIDLMLEILQSIQQDLSTINPILFQDMRRFFPEAWELMYRFRNQCVRQLVEGHILKGIEIGVFRAELNTEIVIELQLRIIDMIVDIYFDMQGKYSLQLIQYHEMMLLMYGMCSPTGAAELHARLNAPDSPIVRPTY